jgi:hypothetical protein
MGDTIDFTSFGDTYRNMVPTDARQPAAKLIFYGHPITLEQYDHNGTMRIAVWMPDETMKTNPLLEQRFGYDRFHELCMAAAQRAQPSDFANGSWPTQAFMVEWAKEHWSEVEKIVEQRSMGWSRFTDLGEYAGMTIKTDRFLGEDGRTYTQLHGPTDKEIAAAKDAARAQAELEAVPGYGSF